MKTSNSEQMFIDTLRAFGLTTDLCEAVNGMRKAVMEAEETGTGDEDENFIETEQELIQHFLSEPHKKLAEKLEELESTAKKTPIINGDIKTIEDYYKKCRDFDGDEYTGNRWPTYKSDDDVKRGYDFLVSHERTTSDDVMRLLGDVFGAYEKIFNGMKKHHVINIKINGNARNGMTRLAQERNVDIDLEELFPLVPRGSERKLIQQTVKKLDSGDRLQRKEKLEILKINDKIYGEYGKYKGELERIIKLSKLEERLMSVSPEAFKKYKDLMDSINYDVEKINDEMFKQLFEGLKEDSEEFVLLKDIRDNMFSLDGGPFTTQYNQFRDHLVNGEPVDASTEIVTSPTGVKSLRIGTRKVFDRGSDGESFSEDNGLKKRESKEFTFVRYADDDDEKIKNVNKNIGSIDNKIGRIIGIVTGLTKNDAENKTRKIEHEFADYVLANPDEIDKKKVDDYIDKIAGGIRNGDAADETVIDKNLSKMLEIVHEWTDSKESGYIDEDDKARLYKAMSENFDRQFYGTVVGKDEDAMTTVMDKIDEAISLINDKSEEIVTILDEINEVEKEINNIELEKKDIEDSKVADEEKKKKLATLGEKNEKKNEELKKKNKNVENIREKMNLITENCKKDVVSTVDSIVMDWSGKERLNDMANVAKEALSMVSHLIDMRSAEEKNIEKIKNDRKVIDSMERENNVIKTVSSKGKIEYRIPTGEGDEGITVATRLNQSIHGVEYDAVNFEYDGKNYGIWTARNMCFKLNENDTSDDSGYEYNANRDVMVRHLDDKIGGGVLYNFSEAKNVCSLTGGWHIPKKREWEALIGECLGNVIENSPLSGIKGKNEGAYLIKSKFLNGLDCFDFGIFPAGTYDPVGEHPSMDTQSSVYYWCDNGPRGMVIKFDAHRNTVEFINGGQVPMACLRLVMG